MINMALSSIELDSTIETINNIEGCAIVAREDTEIADCAGGHIVYIKVECRDYFVEVNASAQLRAYIDNKLFLMDCLRLEHKKE